MEAKMSEFSIQSPTGGKQSLRSKNDHGKILSTKNHQSKHVHLSSITESHQFMTGGSLVVWMRKALLNMLLLIVVVLLVWYLKDNQSKFNLIKNIDLVSLVILSVLALGTGLVNGWKVKFYTAIFGLRLPFKEWFGLGQITSMTNYLTPFKGGTAVRALYLRKKHDFPYEKFVVTLAATTLIAFFVYSILGIIALGYVYLVFKKLSMVMAAIFGGVLIASLCAFFFPVGLFHKIKADNFIIRRMRSVVEGWHHIKNNPSHVMMIAALELSFIIVYGLSLFFGFKAVDVQIPLVFCLLIALLSGMSVIIAITPAGLGVKEAVIVWASTMLGSGILIPLNVAVLLRIISVIWTIPLGFIFSYVLIKEKKEALEN